MQICQLKINQNQREHEVAENKSSSTKSNTLTELWSISIALRQSSSTFVQSLIPSIMNPKNKSQVRNKSFPDTKDFFFFKKKKGQYSYILPFPMTQSSIRPINRNIRAQSNCLAFQQKNKTLNFLNLCLNKRGRTQINKR